MRFNHYSLKFSRFEKIIGCILGVIVVFAIIVGLGIFVVHYPPFIMFIMFVIFAVIVFS